MSESNSSPASGATQVNPTTRPGQPDPESPVSEAAFTGVPAAEPVQEIGSVVDPAGRLDARHDGRPATAGLDRATSTGSMSGTVARGASWSAIGKIGGQLTQVAAGIVLARLLTPADFGLLASVYIVTGFSVLFFELGVASALVQLRDLNEEDLATGFWINAIAGVIFTGLLAAAGPLVADVFNQPALRVLTPIAALTFGLSFGVAHRALLQRQLRYKELSLIALGTTVVGYVVSVALALAGAGYYALAIGPVVASGLTSVFYWIAFPWRPKHFICRASLPRLWRFSGGLFAFNVVNYAGRNADNALIGRYLGVAELGFYSRAYNLMLLPVQQVSSVVGGVMFSALSAIQDDRARAAVGYHRAVKMINVATAPALWGLAATAPGVVPLIWGSQWRATVPLLQILCLAGLSQCTTSSVGWVFQSQNRTGLQFKIGLISTAFGLAGIAVGFPFGVVGLCWAILVSGLVILPINIVPACRLIGLPWQRLVVGNLPCIGVGGVMAVVVWLLPPLLGLSRETGWLVGVQVVVGGVLYSVGMRLVQPDLWADFAGMIKRMASRGA